MSEKLKPCPFCGNTASLREIDSYPVWDEDNPFQRMTPTRTTVCSEENGGCGAFAPSVKWRLRSSDPAAERLADFLRDAVECLGNREEATQNDYEHKLAERIKIALSEYDRATKPEEKP